MPEMYCKICQYWAVSPDDEDVGECRRYAPRPGTETGWALTLYSAWCGEYVERKGLQTDESWDIDFDKVQAAVDKAKKKA